MRRTEAVYIVQVQGGDEALWRDVAEVSVPPKSKRETVIKRAVELSGDALDMSAAAVNLRVIPAEHAEPIKVEMEQPPPRLRIG